jgi:hypothetical protein
LGGVLWLGARAYWAQQEIGASEGLASQIQSDIDAGRMGSALANAQQLATHVDAARSYVSDPVWHAASLLPFVGVNFSTSAELAQILSDVTHRAVLPLTKVAGDIDPAKIRPTHGALDLQGVVAARPAVSEANSALHDAYSNLSSLPRGFGTLPQVNAGIDRLTRVLDKARTVVSSADTAARLFPPLLGDDHPRNYLVLFLNNAELRSTGGIPGAVALVHVDHGRISLTRQANAGDFPRFMQPVLPLAATTQGLYGPIAGQYLQDINLPPQFPLTSRLAAEMWKQRYGEPIDGVLSFDPVALSYVLKATGPIKLPSGEMLNHDNAVRVLLSDAYANYEGKRRDQFFADAAAAVFEKISSGDFQPNLMIQAFRQSASERRLLAWSPQEVEEDAITSAGLSGSLPLQTPSHGVFAVYLNDATGAKMDYYLRDSYRIGGVTCRADGRPTWEVEVTLTNAAPADAGSSLPAYVTGGGEYGVTPGAAKTLVTVYAPPSAIFTQTRLNGSPLDVHRDMDSGYPVAQTEALLAPGQSATLRFQFLGPPQADSKPDLIATPTVNTFSTADLSLTCQDAVR